MDKAQALQHFWESFGWDAYDESTVDEPAFPYITYNVVQDSLGNIVSMYASLWDRSTSWTAVEHKAKEIDVALQRMNPPAIKIDGGRVYLYKGTPFLQRMSDPSDDLIRRMYINIGAEFLTN